jgi:acyl-CoA thioesterase-1
VNSFCSLVFLTLRRWIGKPPATAANRWRPWLLAGVLALPALAGATQAQTQTILVLGDSLSAAYGIPREAGWVALLEGRLPQASIVNASISGETTEGGVNRIAALLEKHSPDIVIVELGGNDGLRGFQLQRIRDNLARLVEQSQSAGARVLLVGMKIPPNYGLRYTEGFHESFSLTAKRYDITLVPFLLDGIATDPGLMQEDGIHPNEKAQKRLLENVWPHLQALIEG